MKKHLLITAIVMALVMCLSFGALAADDIVQKATADDANDYIIKGTLVEGIDTSDLYISTVKDWKANSSSNFPVVANRSTFFENGEAIADNDLILTNGKVAVVLAVGTRNPWGYPAGSVLDAGTVDQGEAKRDMTWSIETLINDWDGWAPDNCGTVTFDLVKYNFTQKIKGEAGKKDSDVVLDAIEVSRIYDIDGVKFDVISYYGVAPDDNFVYYYDYLKNTSGKALSSNSDDWTIGNAFCITNKGDDGGAMFDLYAGRECPIVGSYGINNKTHASYSVGLVVPGENVTSANNKRPVNSYYGAVGYKGVYSFHDWADGESVTYDKYIVMSDSPSLEDSLDFFNDYNKTETTTVSGTINGLTGNDRTAIAVTQDGKTYGWFDVAENGTFEFAIPLNDGKEYKAFVERDGNAAGAEIAIDNTKATVEINTLKAGAVKADLIINLKDKDGNPVWGKVEFLNEYPTVRYTGDSIYQATEKGKIAAKVSDITDFDATVFGEGYYFYSNTVSISEKDVKDGAVDVTVDMKYSLPENWLAADLHHHANKNDAFADPEEAIPSMLASGLDVAFISDHDFTVNNMKGLDLASEYGMTGFLPSEEISASWAHFNVIPQTFDSYEYFLDPSSENHVMNQFAQFKTFVKQTHDHEATITANHPWYSYGLFSSKDSVPGGYTDDYDTIEINSCCQDKENINTINSATDLWAAYATGNEDANFGEVGKAHYLVGGSDTHDVLYPGVKNDKGHTAYVTYATGKIRTVAKVDEISSDQDWGIVENALSYSNAVAAGNSYVTLGPVLEPSIVSGSELGKGVKPGEPIVYDGKFNISIDIKSLSGIRDVVVLSNFGDKTYTYPGMDKKAKTPTEYTINNVYRVYSANQLGGNANEATLNFTANVPEGQSGYFAFMVVDKNDYSMFALTNPYWVQNSTMPSFADVDPNSWYAPYVEQLAAAGIINGYDDGTFRPQNNVSRAEFCKLMAGILPENIPSDKDVKFSDVKEGSWYYDSVMTMAKAGYIQGYGDGIFAPDKEISRAEISTIIYNVFKADLKVNHPDVSFTDVKEDQWFYDAVMALAKAGYVNGKGDNIFAPNEQATRAQAAKFIFVAGTGGETILNSVR